MHGQRQKGHENLNKYYPIIHTKDVFVLLLTTWMLRDYFVLIASIKMHETCTRPKVCAWTRPDWHLWTGKTTRTRPSLTRKIVL